MFVFAFLDFGSGLPFHLAEESFPHPLVGSCATDVACSM